MLPTNPPKPHSEQELSILKSRSRTNLPDNVKNIKRMRYGSYFTSYKSERI